MFQMHKKKFFAGISLFLILLVAVSATTVKDEGPKRNLKVLPKNIDHEELVKIMKGFNVSLGVKCNFCHAQSKTDEKKLDFSSDEKSEKGIARSMMKMTNKINKKYFSYNPDVKDGKVVAVSCITCHNGKEHPEHEIKIEENH